MSNVVPNSVLALLSTIAELRVAGEPWESVAERTGLPLNEVEKLVCGHPREYEEEFNWAAHEARRDNKAGALATLRGLMKSPDPAIQMTAAVTTIRYELARMRHIRSIRIHGRRRRRGRRFRDPGMPFGDAVEGSVAEAATRDDVTNPELLRGEDRR
jgi:hypothetical protein